jgi:hypothetical protein
MSLETAQKVIVPQKKIMSRSFLNSGTLIVNITIPTKNNSATRTGRKLQDAGHFWLRVIDTCQLPVGMIYKKRTEVFYQC